MLLFFSPSSSNDFVGIFFICFTLSRTIVADRDDVYLFACLPIFISLYFFLSESNSPKLARTNWLFWLWNSWPFMKFYCLIKKKFVTMYMILALFIHESQIIDMNHRSKCVTSIRRMFSIGAVVKSTLFTLRIARAWICKCTLMRFLLLLLKDACYKCYYHALYASPHLLSQIHCLFRVCVYVYAYAFVDWFNSI